jgi:predicted DNA-binding protein
MYKSIKIPLRLYNKLKDLSKKQKIPIYKIIENSIKYYTKSQLLKYIYENYINKRNSIEIVKR